MRKVVVAATQFKVTRNIEENWDNAEKIVRAASVKGANVILLQELFDNWYFCQDVDPENLKFAWELEKHPTVLRFEKLAKELGVVLPVSFFEKKNNVYFNSIVIIDADGRRMGVYRKTHIPDDPGYYEKYYFSPGDTGFRVWDTKYGKIGIGICWDQWFPETARCLVLNGAEMILYPTAIGTSPTPVEHWQMTQRGHAAANMVPVIVSNRIGIEKSEINNTEINFYGHSFIADNIGGLVKEATSTDEMVITAEFDLDEVAKYRREACCFRDRRPECYGDLLTLNGGNNKCQK